MENNIFALKGNIIYAKDSKELCINEQSYLVCENGKVRGIYKELPDELKNVPVEDMGDQLIIPGLTDLHVHAPFSTFGKKYSPICSCGMCSSLQMAVIS